MTDEKARAALPVAFRDRLERLVAAGAITRAALAHLTQEKPPCVWPNPMHPSFVAQSGEEMMRLASEKLAQDIGGCLTDIGWAPALALTDRGQRDALTHHPWFGVGAVNLFNASSLIPPLLLDAQPGEEVLDLAAAPGMKSIQIAAAMENIGRLALVEPVPSRFHKLRENLARFHVSIAELYRRDGRGVGRNVPDRFDRVLLDAPCSSEARFRHSNPQTYRHWSVRKIQECARKQSGLLFSAADALKPGGRLVYSTCSLAPEENERIVEKVLKRRPMMRLVDLPDSKLPSYRAGLTQWGSRAKCDALHRSLRIQPSALHDAFFVAVLTKDE